MEQKKLLISLGEIIELTCELVDFLPVRELTVDHQDLDPAHLARFGYLTLAYV